MLEREGLCGIMLSEGSMGKRRVVGKRVRLRGGGGGGGGGIWSWHVESY